MLHAFSLPSGPTACKTILSRAKCRDFGMRGTSDCSLLAAQKPKAKYAPQPAQGGMMDWTDMMKGMPQNMVNNPMGMMMMMGSMMGGMHVQGAAGQETGGIPLKFNVPVMGGRQTSSAGSSADSLMGLAGATGGGMGGGGVDSGDAMVSGGGGDQEEVAEDVAEDPGEEE